VAVTAVVAQAAVVAVTAAAILGINFLELS